MKKDTYIEVSNIKSRPFLKTNGKRMNDIEVVKTALKEIDDYQNNNGVPVPNLTPDFIAFMRDMVREYDENGVTPSEYKQKNIVKTLDYDVVCRNTDLRNKKL